MSSSIAKSDDSAYEIVNADDAVYLAVKSQTHTCSPQSVAKVETGCTTAEESGEKEHTCNRCGETETIPATGGAGTTAPKPGASCTGKPRVKQEGNVRKEVSDTGDNTPLALGATLSMIAGLTYLILYVTDRRWGMSEEMKKELVSRIIGWAKQGDRYRVYLALAAIFVLLVYYHSVGKKIKTTRCVVIRGK